MQQKFFNSISRSLQDLAIQHAQSSSSATSSNSISTISAEDAAHTSSTAAISDYVHIIV